MYEDTTGPSHNSSTITALHEVDVVQLTDPKPFPNMPDKANLNGIDFHLSIPSPAMPARYTVSQDTRLVGRDWEAAVSAELSMTEGQGLTVTYEVKAGAKTSAWKARRRRRGGDRWTRGKAVNAGV